MSETYKNYQNQTLDLMDEWNKEFMKLNDLTSNWTIKITDLDHPYFTFHKSVMYIATNYMRTNQNGENTTADAFNNLIKPLIDITNNELDVNIENEYAFEMSSILQLFIIIERKWNTNIKEYNLVFSGIATSVNNSYSSLLNAKRYFEEKTEVKDLCCIKSYRT